MLDLVELWFAFDRCDIFRYIPMIEKFSKNELAALLLFHNQVTDMLVQEHEF